MSGREGSGLFNMILDSGRMPEGWTSSIQVLIYNNKSDVQNCSKYRLVKLMPPYHGNIGKSC